MLIIKIIFTIDVILIKEFISTIIILIARIILVKNILIIFKKIFIARFVFAKVLFIVNIIKTS